MVVKFWQVEGVLDELKGKKIRVQHTSFSASISQENIKNTVFNRAPFL